MSFLSARTKCGISQVEAGRRLGVSDAAVSMWETGKTAPRAKLLPKIALLYGCSVDELMKDESNETQHESSCAD